MKKQKKSVYTLNTSSIKLLAIAGVLGALVLLFVTISATTSRTVHYSTGSNAKEYKPKINPRDFTTRITNTYFALPPGKKMVYEVDTPDGLERIEITISGSKRRIMGVDTLMYLDKVWLDGQLIEDTIDYLAQDDKGNVWYFGEDVKNYENGEFVDSAGSWIAGLDKAQPGIWMKANPKKGDVYRQEYYKGEAEDMARVVATNVTVKIKKGTYKGCVKTYDYSPLDPEAREYKYYCPDNSIKGLVLSQHLDEDMNPVDNTELVSVRFSKSKYDDIDEVDESGDDDE